MTDILSTRKDTGRKMNENSIFTAVLTSFVRGAWFFSGQNCFLVMPGSSQTFSPSEMQRPRDLTVAVFSCRADSHVCVIWGLESRNEDANNLQAEIRQDLEEVNQMKMPHTRLEFS